MNAAAASPYPRTVFPPPSSLRARGLTRLLVRGSIAVAAWGERRAVRQADAALTHPGASRTRAVRGWTDLSSDRERYLARRAAGFLEP